LTLLLLSPKASFVFRQKYKQTADPEFRATAASSIYAAASCRRPFYKYNWANKWGGKARSGK